MTIKSLIAKYRFNRAKRQILKIQKYLPSADNESAWAIHDEIMKILAPFQMAKNKSHIQLIQEKLFSVIPDIERELGLASMEEL